MLVNSINSTHRASLASLPANKDVMNTKAEKLALPIISRNGGCVPGTKGGPWFACITIAACIPLIEVPPLFAACLAAAGVALATPTP